jgi:ribosome maturation factor RimP
VHSPEQALFDLLEPCVSSQGVDLVEVQLARAGKRQILRLVIHSEQGVTHGDCARVTRAAGAAVDESGALEGSYLLEVSSPGLDRVLRAPREFDVFRGRPVRVRLEEEGGEITGVAAGTRSGSEIVIREEGGDEQVVEWSRVAKARLVPEAARRAHGGGR